MKKKARASRKARMNPADDLPDFFEVVEQVSNYEVDDGETVVEFRSRTSHKESDWAMVPEKHLFNMERYNYRLGETPRMSLSGQTVHLEGGETRPLKWVKIMIGFARRARRDKKGLTITPHTKNSDPGNYPVVISPTGMVSVGCQAYTWNEIEAFEKRYL